MSLLRVRNPARIVIQRVRYYASERGRENNPTDPRTDVIKRSLYPPFSPLDPSPTGVHRSDVNNLLAACIPSLEAHETITRAWLLHKDNVRFAREEALRKKFESMKRAMEELDKVDKVLWVEATRQPNQRKMSAEEREQLSGLKGAERRATEAKIEGLFPREMRVPTDTPRKTGWDHDWKAK